MGAEENKPEDKKIEEEEVKKPEEETEKKTGEEEGVKKPEEETEKKTGEEEGVKKPEETEEKKAEEPQESKEAPPPQDIVLKVFMHCEGCARKVRRCLKGFDGVEDVQTDCKTHKVIVKGEKADPLKVLDRVQKKSHKKVELLSPIPKPPTEEELKNAEENIKPKEEKKKEEEVIITVVLKVHMHCEACAEEIQKRIMRMKGVKTADSNLKGSEVTVKGVFDPPKLVEYIYKRTGKHAVIMKTEPEKKEEEVKEKGNEETAEKTEEGGEEKAEGEKKEGEEAKPAEEEGKKPEEDQTTKVEMEVKKNEFYYYYPTYYTPKYTMDYPYPPQMFSDENPNACSVM